MSGVLVCNADPSGVTCALEETEAFKIKLDNVFKQRKISCNEYKLLYNDYENIVNGLGGTPRPPSLEFQNKCS